jgi:probable phosphoglycerate mutase
MRRRPGLGEARPNRYFPLPENGPNREPLLRRHVGVMVDQWRVEEFTYLDTAACGWTSYAERKGLRDAYWRRCEPLWVDGPGCECFADFIERVRHFEQTLSVQDADKSVVVFTHGLLMRALLWFRQHTSGQVTGSEMAVFDSFRRTVSVPNCAVLQASSDGSGRLRLSTDVFVDHIPEELRTE